MSGAFPFEFSKGVLGSLASKNTSKDPSELLLVSIADIFISSPIFKIDDAINKALALLGEYGGADRAWLIEISALRGTNTHEWCASGIPSAISVVQNMPIDSVPLFTEALLRRETLHVYRLKDLPHEAIAERMLCEASNTKSFVAVPIIADEILIGVFGYDQVLRERKFSQELIRTLSLASDLFSSALRRRSELRKQLEIDITYRTVLDQIREGVAIIDLEGSIHYCNVHFSKMCGESSDRLIGQQLFKVLVSEHEWESFVRGTKDRILGSSDIFTLKISRGKHREGVIEVKVTPYKGITGEVIGSIVTFMDITDRLKSDEERKSIGARLMQVDKMSSVRHLALGVAHDINNCLVGINSDLRSIQSNVETSPQTLQFSAAAMEGCARASNLVKQLLSFSKPECAEFKFINCSTVIEEAVSLIHSSLSPKVNVKRCGIDSNIIVSGDRGQFIQVLTNLILNSQQAMPYGGTIHIRCSRTHINRPESYNKIARSGFYGVITITDTGAGIPEELLGRVFEPFFTTRQEGENYGLGLATVHTIMQNHGGWVEVNSQVGQGTEFSLFLPEVIINNAADIAAVDGSDKTLSSSIVCEKTGMILILEDEPVLADLATRFLERAGFSTKAFCAASEGLQWFHQNHTEVSLILLDMKMPGTNGVESFRALRSIDPDAKVVLISGLFEEKDLNNLLQEGALSYIKKPVQYSELVEWVRRTVKASTAHKVLH